ncbi:hypothetical protein Ddye_026127 [Dipteronia dyeriana]|uniref:Uncharacterized protein n=1 Tax=Dipteronia dyeriana TaxID=168575 RepID=A0AAD9TLN1_9ROSI|nr:hypothetical protein Ddye_026127 [Dipteronia dyeriana]
MQIDCNHAATSSSSMGGLQNLVAQNTHLPQPFDSSMFGNLNFEIDDFVNATWEQNNGIKASLASYEYEFGHVVMVDPMSTRSSLSATWGNSYAMCMPTDSTNLRGALKNFEISEVLTQHDITSKLALPSMIHDHMIPFMNGRDFLDLTAEETVATPILYSDKWKAKSVQSSKLGGRNMLKPNVFELAMSSSFQDIKLQVLMENWRCST